MAHVDGLIALFPLELVLFPGQHLPLHIFEPRYKEMIGECLVQNLSFGVVRAGEDTIADVGCTAGISSLNRRYDDGRMDIEIVGQRRFEVVEVNQERAFLRASVLYQEDESAHTDSSAVRRVIDLHLEIVNLIGSNEQYASPLPDNPQLSYELAGSLPLDLDFKQALLRMRSEADRLTALTAFYEEVLPKLKRAAAVRRKAGGNGRVM